jgi:hypothetical protein
MATRPPEKDAPHASTDAPPLAIQRQLLQNELALWRNTLYMESVRYRVNQRLGDTQAGALNKTEMARIQQHIDAYEDVLAEIEKELKSAVPENGRGIVKEEG